MSRAVLSFINVSSGRYPWWDDFPRLLGRRLALAGIDHVCFYRSFEEASPQPGDGRHPTPEGSLADPGWLERHVRPVAGRYGQVILHTHGHYRPIELWREVRHHRCARWFWTEHQVSESRPLDAARKLGRCRGQRLGRFPSRLFGVSEAGAARLPQQFRASTVRCIRTGVRVEDPVRWRDDGTGRVPRRALFVGRVIPGKGPTLGSERLQAVGRGDVAAGGHGRADQPRPARGVRPRGGGRPELGAGGAGRPNGGCGWPWRRGPRPPWSSRAPCWDTPAPSSGALPWGPRA